MLPYAAKVQMEKIYSHTPSTTTSGVCLKQSMTSTRRLTTSITAPSHFSTSSCLFIKLSGILVISHGLQISSEGLFVKDKMRGPAATEFCIINCETKLIDFRRNSAKNSTVGGSKVCVTPVHMNGGVKRRGLQVSRQNLNCCP